MAAVAFGGAWVEGGGASVWRGGRVEADRNMSSHGGEEEVELVGSE